MGYIDSYPYIVTIKPKQSGPTYIQFGLNSSDQSLGPDGNINSDNMDVYNIIGKPYQSPVLSNSNILNQVGCKLYPIIATDSLGFYNVTNEQQKFNFRDMDSGSGSNKFVSANNYSFISTWYPYFNQAYVSASGGLLCFTLYGPNSEPANTDVAYCSTSLFLMIAKQLTVLVVPN